jgi:hypothetical protein
LFLHPPFEREETREEEGKGEFLSSLIQPKTNKKRGKTRERKKEREREKESNRESVERILSELFEVKNHPFIVKSKVEIAPPRTHPRVGKST